MLTILGFGLLAAVVWQIGADISRELKAARVQATNARALDILQLFAPGISATLEDPRAFLVWQPIAKSARALFPDALASLDHVSGATFPFTADQLKAAHARWTSEWLAWERMHDAEYKLKAAAAEADLAAANGTPLMRARLEAVERDKLNLYQRRYEEYVRVGKALQALIDH